MSHPIHTTAPFCFAAPSYANSVPLVQLIPDIAPGSRVIVDLPARLLPMLQDHTADAALIPVAALFANPGLDMIEGVGICAEKVVRSVLLKCNRPLAQVRTVKLDIASRTSNNLAFILLRNHWKLEARPIYPDAPSEADAEIVIGDRALCEPRAPQGDYDLATAWNQMTGLPFVFAAWAYRHNHPFPGELAKVIHAAKRSGVAALPKLALQVALRLGLSEAVCMNYFTTCIYYDLGDRERQGMQLFKQLITEMPPLFPEES